MALLTVGWREELSISRTPALTHTVLDMCTERGTDSTGRERLLNAIRGVRSFIWSKR